MYCHYIIFELARGGDLLEALKLRPRGFEEHEAQYLIGQAALGLSRLHQRGLAMQDVSLENMLVHILDDGRFQVKVCDPGQATVFQVDAEHGEEVPVDFHGFVGKSFRPYELIMKRSYLASKDPDWDLFKQGKFER
jgi:serine/threonine protein kinase